MLIRLVVPSYMEKQDIMHLARLARIAISDAEADALQSEITDVLSYVSVVNDIAADAHLTKQVGAVHNVFREDEVTTPADTHTEDLLHEAPHTHGRYLEVPKILQND